MEAIHESIDIHGSVDSVFAYVDDPENAPAWLPSMMEVHNITGHGVGARHQWTYKMAGFPLRGESTTIAHIPNERRVVRTRGGMESLWTYVVERAAVGTHLEITVEYSIPAPLLGRLAEKLVVRRNEREIHLAIQNIKDYCEG